MGYTVDSETRNSQLRFQCAFNTVVTTHIQYTSCFTLHPPENQFIAAKLERDYRAKRRFTMTISVIDRGRAQMARSRSIRDSEPTVPQLKNGTTDELGMM